MRQCANAPLLRISIVALGITTGAAVRAVEDLWTPQSIEKFETDSRLGPNCRAQVAAKILEHFPIKQNRRGFPSGANSDSFWWLAEEASPRWPKHCPTTFASV